MARSVLFIVTNGDSAGGICVQAVAEKLIADGWHVSALTQEGNPAALNKKNGICWYTVPRHWSHRTGAQLSPVGRKIVPVCKRLQILAMSHWWPLYAPGMRRRFEKAALRIAEKEHIDVVVPVYNSIDSMLAGCAVKKKYPETKLVLYFLDSLIGGQCASFMKESVRLKKALKWEAKLMKYADRGIMMESARDKYDALPQKPEYWEKMEFLDIPLLVPREDPQSVATRKRFSPEEKVFLFVGTMPRNIRSPLAFLEAFMGLKDPDYRLYLLGSSEYEREIRAAQEKDSRIRFLGFVPHQEALECIQEADYLVNFGNSLSYMVPSKIFEYMAAKKPIISSQVIDNDPSAAYLRHYPAALVLRSGEGDPGKEIEDFLEKCNENSGEELRETVSRLCQKGQIFYRNTPAAFSACLQEVFE